MQATAPSRQAPAAEREVQAEPDIAVSRSCSNAALGRIYAESIVANF